jgi:beta-lactamase class C
MSSDAFPGIQGLVDNYVTTIDQKYGIKIGVAIGAVTPNAGTILYSTAPMVDRGGSQIALGPTTPFEIGSVSKLFTVGIYEERHGDFAVTLGSMLGSQMTMSDAVAAITLKQLAAYASGFPQDNGHCPLHPNTGYPPHMTGTLDSLFNYLRTYDTLAYAPGSTYAYSNLAMSLVAMAALNLDSLDTEAFATAYNNALIQYCQIYGVDPSGSTPTTVIYDPRHAQALPIGYDKDYAEKVRDPCPVPEYGSGGIVSTPSDMLQFLLYCMSNSYPTVLQQPVWKLSTYCHTATQTQTGYGWFIDSQPIKGKTIVSKDGGVGGFTAWIALEQKASLTAASPRGVFVLTNGPDAVKLGREALARILPATSAAELDIPERSIDARVH